MLAQVEVQGPVGAAVPILASFQVRMHLSLTAEPSRQYAALCCDTYNTISQSYSASLTFKHGKVVRQREQPRRVPVLPAGLRELSARHRWRLDAVGEPRKHPCSGPK